MAFENWYRSQDVVLGITAFNTAKAAYAAGIAARVKTRAEVADFLDKQELTEREKPRWHYGKQELRDLLDFIYGGPPASEDEELKRLMGVVSEKC